MYISDTAITKPTLTVVAMLMFVVFGIVALTQLDTDEYPEIDAPVVVVAVPYPGASPDIVEREVVDPIEEAISGISGIDRMRSSSLDSYANIIVEFDFSKDPKVATQEIRDKISSIRNDLPPEMEEPILTQFDPADRPIVSLTLSSPGLTGAELTRMADPDITRRLRGISGVATVNLVGAIERELVVEIRPRDLEATGVSVGQLVQALQSQNLAAPVGRLEGSLDERTIRLKGRLDSPADFKQLVVSQTGGRIVRLGDLADVKDATEEPRSYAAYNDEEAVGFDILKSTGFSTTAVANAVRAKVEELQRELPAGVTLRVVQDGGERVDASVSGVEEALIEGAALTVAVVFLFLNSWRSTVITGLALPVSVLASFVAVWAFGFTLNTMSLLGLSLAIGILIDDAIVVRENIVRHVEMGKDHLKAAHEGTHEIGLAVTATTLSIVVVFIPIAFLGGMAGQWFKPFGLTIACSVLVSLFVSFSLDPMLSAYWPDKHGPLHTRWFISRWLGYFNLWFDRQAERYKSVIAWALDHRYSMIGLALASLHRRPGTAGDGHHSRRARADSGQLDVLDRPRRAAGLESRIRQGEGAGSGPRGPEAAGGGLHLHRDGPRGRRRRRRLGVREAAAEGRAVAHSGRHRGGHPIRDRDDQRPHVVDQRRVEPWREGDSDPAQGAAGRRVDPAGAAGGRTRCARSPARWTWTSRPRVRSRSSRCRSIAALPARSASPWARWRRRCAPRLPASTSATGSIPRVRPATSRSASPPRRAPWWPIWNRCRSSCPDRTDRGRSPWGRSHASSRDWGRRASTTSIAIA